MLCGKCKGDGYLLIKADNLNGDIEYQPIDCDECLGVGEIQIDTTPKYPDSYGNDSYE